MHVLCCVTRVVGKGTQGVVLQGVIGKGRQGGSFCVYCIRYLKQVVKGYSN